jgi:O-antigen/teichoic acid export membrane protein
MKSIKNTLLKSEFTKNSFTLTFGTIIAQCIPILLQPVLRRIYSPEDFGTLAVYLNVFGILTIIAALRYESAIVLPKNDNEAANVLSLSVIITFLSSLFFLLVLLFLKNKIVEFINFPKKYANYLFFLPLTTFLYSVFQCMNFWLIRQKAFKASSINKISRRTAEGVIQLLLGIVKLPVGLLLGDLAGNLTNTISGAYQIRKNKFNFKQVSLSKIKYVFYKYIEFPKYNAVPSLLSMTATMLPFIFINKFFSSEILGFIDLSRLLLSVPLALISGTIAQVLFQRITEKINNKKSFKNDIFKVFYVLIVIVFLEIIIIQLFGRELFGFIFGSKYELSGVYSQILVFSFSLNFIISTFTVVFIALQKILLYSIWQICYFILICFLFFFKHFSIINFITVYVFIDILMFIILMFLLIKVINTNEKKLKHFHE